MDVIIVRFEFAIEKSGDDVDQDFRVDIVEDGEYSEK